jgi:uncharacterized membrane protein
MMTLTPKRANIQIPAALIPLALVPSLAGIARLADLATGQPNAASARFFAAPLPVVLHILGATLFGMLGALQFAPSLRRRTRWHRIAGRLVVPAGLLAALSGLWMTLTYPWANADGVAVYLARLAFGAGMALSLVLGVTSILRGNVAAHRAWMLRGYAIGMAAGTQVFTHLPYFLLIGQPGEGPRAVMMISAWVINLAVAEALIRRPAPRPRTAAHIQPA